jgi:hypothetical protein
VPPPPPDTTAASFTLCLNPTMIKKKNAKGKQSKACKHQQQQ